MHLILDAKKISKAFIFIVIYFISCHPTPHSPSLPSLLHSFTFPRSRQPRSTAALMFTGFVSVISPNDGWKYGWFTLGSLMMVIVFWLQAQMLEEAREKK